MGEQKTQDKINSIQNIFVSLGRIEQVKILEEITAAIAEHVNLKITTTTQQMVFLTHLMKLLKNLSEF